MGLACLLARNLSGADSVEYEREDRSLRVADADDEPTIFAACLRLNVIVPSPSMMPAT
jgi:hypothetical protein